MKRTVLHIASVIFAACVCASCIYNHVPVDPVSPDDKGMVELSFDMKMLGYGLSGAGTDAERISTLRVVIVDLGIDNDGLSVARPTVERNILLKDVSLSGDDEIGLPAGTARLQFPKIHADRRKKIYLLVNAEPTMQSYLDMRLADGTKINTLSLSDDNRLFLPGSNGKVPVEDATFISPEGSRLKNGIPADEELLVPMTAVHTISIPSVEEVIEKYPTIHTDIIYPLPSELYVVRASNKITFEFTNNTWSAEDDFDGIDLLVREWSISEVNSHAYLFAHPGANGNLFAGIASDYYYQVNAPWMQWLKDEAEKSQSSDYRPYYRWQTEYSMPSVSKAHTYSYRPGTYSGAASEGTPADSDGYMLPAPSGSAGTTLSTEDCPVYFGESHPGNPQRYELAFTVWQRTKEQKEKGESWNNPYTYRITSSASADAGDFCLMSLFRNTHVVVNVSFRSGLGRPDLEIDVHPYGSYELDPGFGL